VAVTVRPPFTLVVAWNESSDDVGVVGYEVLRDGARVADVGETSLAQTGLKVAVRYCFTVRALDAAGNRSKAGGPACGELPDLDPPTAPGEPLAAGNASTRVELGWQPSKDNVAVTGYEVLRSGKLVSTVAGWRASETGLTPDTEYCYAVRALDAAGNRSSDSESFCARTAAPGSLSAPVGLRAVSVSADGVSLAWEPSDSKDVVYRVYGRSKRKASRSSIVGVTNSIAFTDAGVPPGVPRCYTVVSVDKTVRESPRSLETCATTPETVPVAQTP
jgi:fibronectin type 3 domain-containing protein